MSKLSLRRKMDYLGQEEVKSVHVSHVLALKCMILRGHKLLTYSYKSIFVAAGLLHQDTCDKYILSHGKVFKQMALIFLHVTNLTHPAAVKATTVFQQFLIKTFSTLKDNITYAIYPFVVIFH